MPAVRCDGEEEEAGAAGAAAANDVDADAGGMRGSSSVDGDEEAAAIPALLLLPVPPDDADPVFVSPPLLPPWVPLRDGAMMPGARLRTLLPSWRSVMGERVRSRAFS